MALVQCYNKGCGQKFDPDKNDSDSCRFHPGPEQFHDAYKIWKCCQKKSTDFSTWLSYPGCTKGPHNPTKPEEPAKIPRPMSNRDVACADEPEVHTAVGFKPPQAAPRDGHSNAQPIQLNVTVQSGLKTAIEKRKQQEEEENMKITDDDSVKGGGDTQIANNTADIPSGTKCCNNACGKEYDGYSSRSADDDCQHHPGMPVFHEGLKYWSCCRKTTTEFNSFIEQAGCTFGRHCYISKKAEDAQRMKQPCREDWFSRGGDVVITIYSKGTLPDNSEICATPVSLTGTIVHNFGNSVFPLDYQLWGAIDPSTSTVNITERKVEICLKKVDPINWPRLRYDPNRDNPDDKS